ncbi:hypothetical protein K3495_g5735 [Podosphaera aphanis]|nr:hypothetical protein K3495_g5735 [Podosphaera aphanis]
MLFIDDMLVTGRRPLIDDIKHKIMKRWSCKNLGPVKTFVGFQIKRHRPNRSIFIHQEMYIRELLKRFGMKDCNGVSTPMVSGIVLKEHENDELLDDDNAALYRHIVGSTIYLSNGTRPDVSYAVGQLARFMAKPRFSFLLHAKHLLRFLKRTANYGITHAPNTISSRMSSNVFDIYSDATWGTENDRKSFQGYTVVYNGGAISWAAQRRKSTALSSMEAEIIAASEGAKEAAWMEKLWNDLNQQRYISTLWCDHEAAKEFCKDSGKFHNKAKHIEIRYFHIRNDMISRNRLGISKIAETENPADILTKQLPCDLFSKHSKTLGIKASSAQ